VVIFYLIGYFIGTLTVAGLWAWLCHGPHCLLCDCRVSAEELLCSRCRRGST
jgi:hypothetical protein